MAFDERPRDSGTTPVEELMIMHKQLVLNILNTIENCTVADAPGVIKAIREDILNNKNELDE